MSLHKLPDDEGAQPGGQVPPALRGTYESLFAALGRCGVSLSPVPVEPGQGAGLLYDYLHPGLVEAMKVGRITFASTRTLKELTNVAFSVQNNLEAVAGLLDDRHENEEALIGTLRANAVIVDTLAKEVARLLGREYVCIRTTREEDPSQGGGS